MYRLLKVLLLGAIALPECQSAPAITYDQRQDGEVNIRADLQNFLLVVIPTNPLTGSDLLDFLSKSGLRSQLSQLQQTKSSKLSAAKMADGDDNNDVARSRIAEHYLERKSPYRVDISNEKGNLARLHPEIARPQKHDSPILTLKKNDRVAGRSYEVPVGSVLPAAGNSIIPLQTSRLTKRSLRADTDINSTGDFDHVDSLNKMAFEDLDDELKLLGSPHEQCGPGRRRDRNGVCEFAN